MVSIPAIYFVFLGLTISTKHFEFVTNYTEKHSVHIVESAFSFAYVFVDLGSSRIGTGADIIKNVLAHVTF